MHRFFFMFVLGFAALGTGAGSALRAIDPGHEGRLDRHQQEYRERPRAFSPGDHTVEGRRAEPVDRSGVHHDHPRPAGCQILGTRGSATKVEPVIGVISADGKRIRVIPESGGLIEGTFVDNDSIEIFYLENRNGESVAATNVFKRKK